MKKFFLFSAILPILFLTFLSLQLPGASSGPFCITVTGKVSGVWHPDLAVCNGKDFFPVKKDGTFSFSYIQKSGTPFAYLTLPDSCKAVSPWKFPLKYGKNDLAFQIAPQSCSIRCDFGTFPFGLPPSSCARKPRIWLLQPFRFARQGRQSPFPLWMPLLLWAQLPKQALQGQDI